MLDDNPAVVIVSLDIIGEYFNKTLPPDLAAQAIKNILKEIKEKKLSITSINATEFNNFIKNLVEASKEPESSYLIKFLGFYSKSLLSTCLIVGTVYVIFLVFKKRISKLTIQALKDKVKNQLDSFRGNCYTFVKKYKLWFVFIISGIIVLFLIYSYRTPEQIKRVKNSLTRITLARFLKKRDETTALGNYKNYVMPFVIEKKDAEGKLNIYIATMMNLCLTLIAFAVYHQINLLKTTDLNKNSTTTYFYEPIFEIIRLIRH